MYQTRHWFLYVYSYLISNPCCEIAIIVRCVCSGTQSCPTLCDPWSVTRQAPLSTAFLGKFTRVGCHLPCQGILLTKGQNLCLPYLPLWQADSLPRSHLGTLGIIAMTNLQQRKLNPEKLNNLAKVTELIYCRTRTEIHTSLLRLNFRLFNILTMALQGGYCYHLHFLEKKTRFAEHK